METTTVSFKDIMGSKTLRMDAQFHVVVSKVKLRAVQLEKLITKEVILERLSELQTKDLHYLKALTTGNREPDRDHYL